MLNDYAQLLVIILSVVLTIFLIASTIALVKLVQILRSVSRMVERAEQVADEVEHTAAMFRKAAGPFAIFKIINSVLKTMGGKHK